MGTTRGALQKQANSSYADGAPTVYRSWKWGNAIIQDSDEEIKLADAGKSEPRGDEDHSNASFVVLHHMNSPIEAEMVNDILRQNGVRSVAQSSGGDALAVLSTSASGAIVLVDERDYDKALELYTAFFGEDTSPLTGPGIDESDPDAGEEAE